jgi:hypothetical protein
MENKNICYKVVIDGGTYRSLALPRKITYNIGTWTKAAPGTKGLFVFKTQEDAATFLPDRYKGYGKILKCEYDTTKFCTPGLEQIYIARSARMFPDVGTKMNFRSCIDNYLDFWTYYGDIACSMPEAIERVNISIRCTPDGSYITPAVKPIECITLNSK